MTRVRWPRAARFGRPAAALALGLASLLAGRGTAAPQPVPAQAREAYRQVATWVSDVVGLPPEAFLEPRGVTVDPYDGTVFVVDGGNNRVQVFQADGTFVRTLGDRSGPGALDQPQDVAVQGSLAFVSDRGHGRVAVFTVEGAFVTAWPGLAGPWGIAAAEDGRVFVVENEASRIAVFRSDGRRLATWAGLAGGAFSINRPRGVDVTRDGRLAVADYGNERLVILDRDGVVQRVSGRLVAPLDLAVDGSGSIYVVHEDGLIRRYDDRTDFPLDSRTWPLPGGSGIGAEADGTLFASFQDDERPLHGVQRWSGRPLTPDVVWGGVPQPLGRIDGPFRVAAADTALVADRWRRAQRFDSAGRAVGQLPTGGINDLAMAPDGGAHVVRDGDVARLDATGRVVWRHDLPSGGPDHPWGVALDYDPAADRVAVLDIGTQAVLLLDGHGQPAGDWTFRPGPGTQAMLWDLAQAPGGYYTVNRKSDALERRDGAGAVVASWAVPGGPLRVASDLAGQAFVLNRYGWVWKYRPDGTLLAVWRSGNGDPATSQPSDLALDSQGRVLVVDALQNQVEVFALDPDGIPGTVPTFEPTCTATGDKTAAPSQLWLGEQTTVTLAVRGSCPGGRTRADIALVIDHSGSMTTANKLAAAQEAARAFLDATDFSDARVAVVGFNQDALLLQPLTANRSNARAVIDGLVAGGGTDIAEGVATARQELTGARRRWSASAVIVLLTDGGSDPVAARQAAERAKLEGIRLFTIGFGQDAATTLLEAMASAPGDYYFAPDATSLGGIYRSIANRVAAQVLFSTLTVTDVLPANMRYVESITDPPPVVNGQALIWQLADVPLTGLALAYRVQPLAAGRWPTNVLADGQGTDGLGQRGRVEFPVPEVTVRAAAITPSPTATVAPSATPPATASPTPPPTDTGPAPRHTVLLPIASRHDCLVRSRHVDVVLVVDTSDSMLDPAPGGGTKLDEALTASRGFVDLLDLRRDAAAVVYFNATAAIWQPLTRDGARLRAALAGLPQAPGTRIDRGLEQAAAALAGPGRDLGNAPAVVVLTDGRPTGTTNEAVLNAAAILKGNGVIIYAIGLGADVDGALLTDVATGPGHLVLAPDVSDLARIYADIARALPCLGP